MNIETTRPNEFNQIGKWLDTDAQPGRVDLFGISGYGGIGKSFLLRHAFDHYRPESKGYLNITLDGSDQSILGDFMGLYDRSLAPRSISCGKRNFDYFPHARHLAIEHTQLSRSVRNDIKRSKNSDKVKEAANLIFRGGSFLNRTVPKTKEYLDFEALKKYGVDSGLDDAVDLLSSLKILDSSSWIPGPLKDVTGITYRERLKNDLYHLAADEWIADLCAILNRYQRIDRWKLMHSPIQGINRLLLVIDDFEILGKTIIDFITTALIPALQKSNFHSTLIFVGRDDISDANVAFQHHLSHLIREKIRLDKFSDEVAKTMFINAGYAGVELDSLLEESLGYPFLVNLLCDAKGGSVSFYQQFFERTTRWMAPTEKKWVLPLCYLDRITETSVELMIPDVPSSSVVGWFKNEASIRDPAAEWYVIAPYIRRTLLEFNRRQIGLKKHEDLIIKGKYASEQA
jgi:hypothetical protein